MNIFYYFITNLLKNVSLKFLLHLDKEMLFYNFLIIIQENHIHNNLFKENQLIKLIK